MGADLFIEQIYTPNRNRYASLALAAQQILNQCAPGSAEAEAAKAEVIFYSDQMFSAGYFRDSYNGTSVLTRLGLSWWQNVRPLLDKNGVLKGKALKQFRKMVHDAQLKLPTSEELAEAHMQLDAEGENSLAGWHKYFREQRALLLEFIDQAIAWEGTILCSL